MPPTPQEQIQFLMILQRLLAEGQFTATYKYTLLMALANLAVEQGDDSGAPLRIATRAIAEKFIEYYWRQAVPYATSAAATVLRQNTDRQAAVIRLVAAARQRFDGSLPVIVRDPLTWHDLVGAVDQVVRVMPLWKFQRVGREVLDFLYPNNGRGAHIELRPGIAYCFRQFHPMVQDMVQGAWLRDARALNTELLGESTDLREFLFGGERAILAAVRPVLIDLQAGRCFYCGDRMYPEKTQVDHCIPWSRYAADLAHNFVLADSKCNNRKRDRIPAVEHLARWTERNARSGGEITGALRDRLPVDLGCSIRVAHWAYAQTEAARGLTWVRREVMEPLIAGVAGISHRVRLTANNATRVVHPRAAIKVQRARLATRRRISPGTSQKPKNPAQGIGLDRGLGFASTNP
jgi:5-methylcytosine-specific restriction endonuclease McrA